MLIRVGKLFLACLVLSLPLLGGCQMIQEQTNREAPNQVQQKEGRKEIKEDNQEKEKQSEDKKEE